MFSWKAILDLFLVRQHLIIDLLYYIRSEVLVYLLHYIIPINSLKHAFQNVPFPLAILATSS